MRVLILGGNRFVGAELVSRAVIDGHDVTVLALDPPMKRVQPYVRWVKANRTKPEELATALDGLTFDAVIDNIAFTPTNVKMLWDVLQNRIGRYVLTSSVDIYSKEKFRINIEEKAELEPSNQDVGPKGERYLRGKRGCEKELMKLNIPWAIVRPALVSGRTDFVPPPPAHLHGYHQRYGRSMFFSTRVADKGPILLRQDDRRVFRTIHVQDVASAQLLVAQHPDAVGQAFNLTGDEVWTSERLVRSLCIAAGTSPDIVRVSTAELESAGIGDYDAPYGARRTYSVADNRKIRSLGWEPTPAKDYLKKLVEIAPPTTEKPFYDYRLREIALAHRIKRCRQTWIPPKKINRRKRELSQPNKLKILNGSFSQSEATNWKQDILQSPDLEYKPAENHFRLFRDRPVSSIGIGTHRGRTDSVTDAAYLNALQLAVKGGINVIDTAINYRAMMAERIVGKAVRELATNGIPRNALCICSKGGIIPWDANDPRSADNFIMDEFVVPGLISAKEYIRRHSIKKQYIKKSLEFSLENLGLEHIDVYYIHNPERSLSYLGLEKFLDRLGETFEMLEEAAAQGQIGVYGLATWPGFRVPTKSREHLPLEQIYDLAIKAGGEDHHFGAVQLPLNIHNTQALTRHTQADGAASVSSITKAFSLGLQIFTSASIYQAQTIPANKLKLLAKSHEDMDTIQNCLNFTRSVPGVGTALVGMKQAEHVHKALAVASYPCLSHEAIAKTTSE